MYAEVMNVGTGQWQVGKIENHTARPLTDEEIKEACRLLNDKTNLAKPEAVLPLLGEAATTECVHGERLKGLCNACSDKYGYGKRLINEAV